VENPAVPRFKVERQINKNQSEIEHGKQPRKGQHTRSRAVHEGRECDKRATTRQARKNPEAETPPQKSEANKMELNTYAPGRRTEGTNTQNKIVLINIRVSKRS